MSESPLISIVTINYNNAAGLKKTMFSVLNQPFDDFEYIIIDGGSNDGSKDVIEEMIKTHPCGKKISFWCSEKDNGIYNAMNKGINHCNGKFIGLMNSGDFYCENVFSKVALFAEKFPDSILYGAAAYYNKDDFLFVDCCSYKDLPKRMIPHEGSFVPADIYKKYGIYDESYKITSDYEAFLRFFDAGVKFQFLDCIIYHFFTDGISNSSRHIKLLRAENKRTQKAHNYYVPSIKRYMNAVIEHIKIMFS